MSGWAVGTRNEGIGRREVQEFCIKLQCIGKGSNQVKYGVKECNHVLETLWLLRSQGTDLVWTKFYIYRYIYCTGILINTTASLSSWITRQGPLILVGFVKEYAL